MTKSKEDAVSPVIGVILMVAVTVILAAVIAAFVFGMGSNVQKSKVVAVTGQNIDDSIVLTFQGGQDAGQVSGLTTTATVADGNAPTIGGSAIADGGAEWTAVTVGSTQTLVRGAGATADTTNSAKVHVVVTATFLDGTQAVVLDAQY